MNTGKRLVLFVSIAKGRIVEEEMKPYNTIVWIVVITLLGIGLLSLGDSRMSRDKKKITVAQLEEHVLDWAEERMHDLRNIVDMFNDSAMPEEQLALVNDDIACQLVEIRELIKPIRFDRTNLIEWSDSFIERHLLPEN